MNKISLLKLYLIFFKIGVILLGGGYVILPILISELSEKRKLIEQNEIYRSIYHAQTKGGK